MTHVSADAPLTPRRVPRPFDLDRAKALHAYVPDLAPMQKELIVNTGACSPYLAGLIQKEADWLPEACADPKAALEAVLAAVAAGSDQTVASDLRRAKRRIALLAALCDLGEQWDLGQVTGALTRLADAACHAALGAAVNAQLRRGKLPGMGPQDPWESAGMTVLAMGKMGAGELNYSSDVDLICLFDETRFDSADYHDARMAFLRATRQMCATLSDITADGYVFRTDLRLRPDPSVTPVVLSMEAAERYYESVGRTWERAAFIKARACAGDVEAGTRFLHMLRPFVWRRHLDFAAIQDAHDMRLAIREHKGTGGAITLPGHDMKLGRGGIREIEFFTQTRQLIAGGRDPDLQVRGTVEGLSVLAEKGWVPAEVAARLSDHYAAHRLVEHRVQMMRDAQTHQLPQSPEGFARLADLMDMDVPDLMADLSRRLEEVHHDTEGFFAPRSPSIPAVRPQIDLSLTDRWATYPALRSARAAEVFARIRPVLLEGLARTARPEEALRALDGFLAGLPAGVQLFSLFEANPQLIDLLLDIVGTSPVLARHLSRNSGVFDAVIGGAFFGPWPDEAAWQAELVQALEAEADYESQLDIARRWAKEWHFRIGVHLLRGVATPKEASRHYARLARVCVAALWPTVQQEFARRFGPAPGRGACVVGMGSLGAGQLTAASDLDLIVVYDAGGVEASDGPKSLPTRTYYARLTQALITALTANTAQGRLYEVDMRLRPSGNQGPVATSWASFQAYQTQEAWTWEHMALTRARVVAGAPDVAADITGFIADLVATPRDVPKMRAELAAMRARIAASRQVDNVWAPKAGPGRLQDIELVAQVAALAARQPGTDTAAALQAGVAAGLWGAAQAADLQAAYALWFDLQSAGRLLTGDAIDPSAIGQSGTEFILRTLGQPDVKTLSKTLECVAAQAAAVIDAVAPPAEAGAKE